MPSRRATGITIAQVEDFSVSSCLLQEKLLVLNLLFTACMTCQHAVSCLFEERLGGRVLEAQDQWLLVLL